MSLRLQHIPGRYPLRGTSLSDPVQILYDNLGALPDDEFGTITLLPFSVEGDEVNAIKRKVAESIVKVFTNAGYAMTLGGEHATPNRQITVACRSCSQPLIVTTVDDSGHAAVPAAVIINGLSQRSPECPHDVLTLDDHRRLIEEAVASQGGE